MTPFDPAFVDHVRAVAATEARRIYEGAALTPEETGEALAMLVLCEVASHTVPTPAIERLRDRLTEPDDPPGLREIAAAVVELADMLRARRPAP